MSSNQRREPPPEIGLVKVGPVKNLRLMYTSVNFRSNEALQPDYLQSTNATVLLCAPTYKGVRRLCSPVLEDIVKLSSRLIFFDPVARR